MVKMLIENEMGYCPVCGELMEAVPVDEYPDRDKQTVTAWECGYCAIDVTYTIPIDGNEAEDGVNSIEIIPFAS